MSSFTTTIRKRGLKALGFFRQTGKWHQEPGFEPEFRKFPVGTGPIRDPEGNNVGRLWAQAA